MAQTINNLPEVLTDEQINTLEQQGDSFGNQETLTDEQINRLEQSQTLPEPEIPKEPSTYDKVSEGMGKFATGFAKGELKTVQGLSKFGGKILQGFGFKKPEPVFSQKFEQTLEPKGTLETAGNITERVAEFLAPSKYVQGATTGLASQAGKAVPFLKGTTEMLVKSGIGALTSGGQTAIQRGEVDKAAKINALISALIPPVSAGFAALGKKIGFSVIKPNQADIRDVKAPAGKAAKTFTDNIYKHNVGGSLRETAFKTETKLQKLSQQLTHSLKESDETIDLSKSYYDTYKQLYNSPKTFGSNEAINSSLGRLAKEIDTVSGGNMEKVPLLTANQIKQGAGSKGAWVFGRVDPDSAADEIVYSRFYSILRDQIDEVGPPVVKRINKTISELIPIRNAVLRRIPVAERNNLLSLNANIGLYASIFNPQSLALVAAEQMSKSGKFANFLVNAADSYFRKVGGSVLKGGVSSFMPTNQLETKGQKIPLIPREK